MINFENPELFGLAIPVLIAGLYLLKKGTKKGLIISRIIVAILLVAALASPFALVPRVTDNDTPDIVLISDKTASMGLFEDETATNLYESLTAKTPTTLVELTGDSTSLGDAIMQYSRGDNQIAIITDGNNNHGAELTDALQFAKETGTTVYAVEPELKFNDLSVQILGDKTVIVNSDIQFDVLVTQAGEEEVRYKYELYSDGDLIRSSSIVQTTKQKTIPIPQVKFKKLGAHTLKIVITPSSYDHDNINNVFYKTVYAVPKPKIRAIGLESSSPLANIIQNLYSVSSSGELENIDDKKAIIIDDTHANSFSEAEVEELKDYLNEGRGIVVVGGEKSYNYGDYLDSPIEEILPVISKPTDWSGGRNIVLVLDTSISADHYGTSSDVLSNAIVILNDKELRDSYAGVITFGGTGEDISKGLVYLGTRSNIDFLENQLENNVLIGGGSSQLDKGLLVAEQWLENENGRLEIIILSDGGIGESYEESLQVAQRLSTKGISFYYIRIQSTDPRQEHVKDKNGNYYAKMLMDNVLGEYHEYEIGERVDINFGNSNQMSEKEYEENDTSNIGVFPLVELNTKHFITSNVDLDGNITGYNDVTPKAGADRLIITSTGKPVLTTWRYGLGRVAALSTDNGLGADNRWATGMYSGNNSKLLSSTVNWAIGNLREETGAVLEAPDTWYGSPAEIELTMYDEGIPKLKLDGEDVTLSLTGNNVYEAVVSPSPIGVHDLSGYPIAVNYAIEYRDVGLNEDLPSTIKAYGGKTYGENEARAQLLEDARQSSQKVVRDTVSQKIYFLLAALILFLGEVIVRRWKEIQEMKKQQNEIQEQ
jgi:hypothetical protein